MKKSGFRASLYFMLFCCITTTAFTQENSSNTKYELESGIYASTSNKNPFWLRTNQFGIVPIESQFLTFRGGIYKDFTNKKTNNNKTIKWGYGLNGIVNVGRHSQLFLQEAFVKTNFKAFELYIGRRREIFGLVDSTLSSGSYAWSGNALPMPKIQFQMPNYVPIIGKGLISIKGSYGHGWFNNEQLSNSYLHQKTLYSRIGNEKWKVKFYGGFNHQVQWGGKINLPYQLSTVKSNQIPSSFSDYIFVVSGISLNYNSRQKNIDTTKYTDFDLTNRVGNHLGTLDIGVEVNTNISKVLFYRQSLYDDGSLFSLANIKDGLIGLSIVPQNNDDKRQFIVIKKIILENLNTSNQGGAIGPTSTIPEIRGRDNYFNHPQFLNGWSYQNKTIGTPFITPTEDIKNTYPKYTLNIPQYLEYFTNNNRVKVYYIGIQLKILDKYDYFFRGSYSKNYGSYDVPFTNSNKGIAQYSFQNSIQFDSRKKLKFNINWAFDIGSLFQSSNGISCSIKRQW